VISVDPLTGMPTIYAQPKIIHMGGGGGGGGSATDSGGIPEYTTDPISPEAETAWMLRTPGAASTGGGIVKAFIGGGFPVSSVATGGGTPDTYQLSYRTLENTTIRVSLS
jgi:hypothetical protein